MTFKRWIPTFLAFPIAGWLAIETIGPVAGPLSAAAGGLLVGAAVGAAQWLALRPRAVGRRWIGVTAAAMAGGAALAATITGAGTEVADAMVTGLVSGAAVGTAQATLLGRGAALWAVATTATWPLGWLVSSAVVDLDRGFHAFGSSGAILVTVVTGLALRGGTTFFTRKTRVAPALSGS